MSYIIKVPVETLDLTDDKGNVVRSENYFWFMVKMILNGYAQGLKGVDLLDFSPVWKLVKTQDGQKTMAIRDERDYKKMKELVEQHKGWIGQNATDFGIAIIEAIRNAEKAEDKDEKSKAKDK